MCVSVESLHTRFLAFPPQRPAQHLLPPSPMHNICATVASAFILRRCAPVTFFVYQVRRLLERACRTDAGAITPSTHARLCSNSPLAIVGAFHFARIGNALDFKIFANKKKRKHARAIGLGEGRGPTWPLGTHHVDGGVWNAWVCACANHTRPTRGTRRELGSEVNSNEELVNIYRQTPHKSSQEVSRLRWVLLGTAAQRCRNSL